MQENLKCFFGKATVGIECAKNLMEEMVETGSQDSLHLV